MSKLSDIRYAWLIDRPAYQFTTITLSACLNICQNRAASIGPIPGRFWYILYVYVGPVQSSHSHKATVTSIKNFRKMESKRNCALRNSPKTDSGKQSNPEHYLVIWWPDNKPGS